MPSVLITAFEPYAVWTENSSWLALVELTKDLPPVPEVTTRLYPTDIAAVRTRLAADLEAEFDYALHLGQAPGSGQIQLEAIGINVGSVDSEPDGFQPLMPDGPAAYQSDLPLACWARKLRQAGIPSRVSHHAGTYVCNAILYLSHYFAERNAWKTKSAFVHVPLELSQAVPCRQDTPAWPSSTTAAAISLILGELASENL
jgi:pyroglutamyl-peptidase